MCLPATAIGIQQAGLAISAISTGFSIMSANQQANMAQQQANLQHQNQQRQAHAERQAQVAQHMGAVKAQQAQTLAAQQQIHNNSEAANRGWVAEQNKLNEARAKAAFKSQEIYAKSIGTKGKILASGQTGQSIGLLALDAERQAGFATAQQTASLESAATAAGTQMEAIGIQNRSANNQVLSSLSAPVGAPQFAPDPMGNAPLNLGIPSYDWG